MTHSEFIQATERLESYYGKEYTNEQNIIAYEELKDMSIERYRQIVTQCIRTSKFLPKVADILEIHKELPYSQRKQVENKKVYCAKCNSKGYVIYQKDVKNGNITMQYPFFARCDCANGLEHAYDGTKISDTEHRTKYYVPTVAELGI